MKNKALKVAVATAALASTSAAIVANKKATGKKVEEQKQRCKNYRNTERGKHEKNSKGIYYTNGNYEAFARPKKPANIENKHAYIVGSGLASLATACF